MRIQFDISKRPQIESGEYKVVYVENSSSEQCPVEILKWDSNSDAGCIIGCVRRKGKDRIYAFQENGVHTVSDEDDRLFIVTPEPELSEWELAIAKYRPPTDSKETTQRIAAELLSLAKSQLLQSGELLTQEHHEKLMETQYKETLDGVKKNWHDYFTPQAVTDIYNAGRNDVLKDLPRWKSVINFSYGLMSHEKTFYNNTLGQLFHKGKKLYIYDLEKLPGFKEEDHE